MTRHLLIAFLSVAAIVSGCEEIDDPGTEEEQEQYGYGADVAAPSWLELPATKAGDGKEWFAHYIDGSDNVRNWSFDYDYASYVSSWVAYPLNSGLIGSGTRTDAWGYDPLLPMRLQQDVSSGYGTGMDRGHQIPSADRLNYSTNVTTFYATNMTPQEHDFNGGVWEKLESKVRSYARICDTLYVVTGCVVDGSSKSTRDKMLHNIKVPTAYYKALLRYIKNSSGGDYIACGFYLPHDSSINSDSFMDYIMSVEELEKKTGMDFFTNLPEVVGASKAREIESQKPSSWWDR